MMISLTDVPPDPEVITALLEGWTRANEIIIAAAQLPSLYALGVRYKREPKGAERWQLAHALAVRLEGDCEDLAAYRAAECRLAGDQRARAIAILAGHHTIHCVVQHGNGMIEDPSAILGMGEQQHAV